MKLKKLSIHKMLLILFLAMCVSLHGESSKTKKQIVFVRDDDGEFFQAVSDQFRF